MSRSRQIAGLLLLALLASTPAIACKQLVQFPEHLLGEGNAYRVVTIREVHEDRITALVVRQFGGESEVGKVATFHFLQDEEPHAVCATPFEVGKTYLLRLSDPPQSHHISRFNWLNVPSTHERYATYLSDLEARTAKQPPAGVGSDGIFRITPQRPVPELRAEALAAHPPAESGQFRKVDLIELTKLDPTIQLDIRYATTNNFLSTPVYTRPAAYLQRPAAEALLRVHRALSSQGYGLLIHDAYRPWWVTKVFWEATPPSLREFVADPAQGSRHNRGCAVDLTLYDLRTGQAVSMPSVYDEMSPRAYPNYAGGTPAQREHRELLRRSMERQGFTVYETEWWHFDFKDWREYPIVNENFDDRPATQ